MKQYEVLHGTSGKTVIYAENANKAKREVCKLYGIKPNDYWCGVSNMSAKPVTTILNK